MDDLKSSHYTNISTMADAEVPLMSDQKDSHVFVDTTNLDPQPVSDGSSLNGCASELPPVDKRCLEQLRKAGVIARPTIMVGLSNLLNQ